AAAVPPGRRRLPAREPGAGRSHRAPEPPGARARADRAGRDRDLPRPRRRVGGPQRRVRAARDDRAHARPHRLGRRAVAGSATRDRAPAMSFPMRASGVLASAVLLFGGCAPHSNAFAAAPPPKVTVGHPVQRNVTHYLEYTATVEAHQMVELRARVPGFLDSVQFKPGARVKQGDLLFVIDKRTYEAAVARADAQLASDQAALQGAESDAKIAEELASQRAGSEIDRIIKAARRDSARAAIAAAQAELARARLDLEFCEVRAPISGRITKNFVDVGNLVGQGLPTPLATLVEQKPVY